jgi:5-methylcytosine-specific restriction endonuclease McrA
MAARDRIRDYFIANVGKVLTTARIRRVAGVSEYARRLRELRDIEGFQIKSHLDRSDLKPGEYILETLERKPAFGRGASPQLRNEILERNGYTCQLCGAGPGDSDPYNPNRKVRLHVDHIKPLSQGGRNEKSNLRVLCSACNQGKSNVTPPSDTALNILARIRKLSRADQLEIFNSLKRKFEA